MQRVFSLGCLLIAFWAPKGAIAEINIHQSTTVTGSGTFADPTVEITASSIPGSGISWIDVRRESWCETAFEDKTDADSV